MMAQEYYGPAYGPNGELGAGQPESGWPGIAGEALGASGEAGSGGIVEEAGPDRFRRGPAPNMQAGGAGQIPGGIDRGSFVKRWPGLDYGAYGRSDTLRARLRDQLYQALMGNLVR